MYKYICIDGTVYFILDAFVFCVCVRLRFLVLTESALNMFVAFPVLISVRSVYLLQHSVVHLKSISLGMNTNESRKTDGIRFFFSQKTFQNEEETNNAQNSNVNGKLGFFLFILLQLLVVYIHLRFLME